MENQTQLAATSDESDAEVLPVATPTQTIARPTANPLINRPAVQVAAVAATGFAAGAVTVAAVGARRAAKNRRKGRRVIGSRSFLVDLHLLDR